MKSKKLIAGLLAVQILALWGLALPNRALAVGTWVPLAHTAPGYVGLMLLLPDGTVMAKSFSGGSDGYGNVWYKLTPDSQGHYVNGTWTTLASMADTRLWFSSAVLQDGRVFVAGGEYGSGGAKAEIYDPQTNTWTQINPPASLLDPTQDAQYFGAGTKQSFYDSNAKILPNGNVLVTPVLAKTFGVGLIYNPTTNAWSNAGMTYTGYYMDESTWVKLPDNSILTIDPFGTNSERYITTTNTWINDGTVPVSLYDSFGSEMGGGFRLPDGRAFFLGATGATAYYTPTGTTSPGTWAAGPTIPSSKGTPDAPAAMMPNGKILCAVSPVPTTGTHFPTPTSFYEFDYSVGGGTFTAVASPFTNSDSSYTSLMLDLPDGTVLYSSFRTLLYVYQPDGSPVAAGKPTVSTVAKNGDGSLHLTGTLFNGISEGASYGDDAQMDTNYPIVQFVNGAGSVYYGRTYNWSSTGVATGATVVTTECAPPVNLPVGRWSLQVVANGIASDTFPLTTPSTVWVDFTFAGTSFGTFDYPYKTLADGSANVAASGLIEMKGPRTTTTPISIPGTKAMRLEAVGGTVHVGN